MSYVGFLNQTITIRGSSTTDEFGKQVFEASGTAKARFQQSNKTVLDSHGNVKSIDALIFVKAELAVDNDDKITYESVDYKVVGIKQRVGKNGVVHHQELEVVRWA